MIGNDCLYCETAVTTGYLPTSVHTVNALEPEAVAADGVTAVGNICLSPSRIRLKSQHARVSKAAHSQKISPDVR